MVFTNYYNLSPIRINCFTPVGGVDGSIKQILEVKSTSSASNFEFELSKEGSETCKLLTERFQNE